MSNSGEHLNKTKKKLPLMFSEVIFLNCERAWCNWDILNNIYNKCNSVQAFMHRKKIITIPSDVQDFVFQGEKYVK